MEGERTSWSEGTTVQSCTCRTNFVLRDARKPHLPDHSSQREEYGPWLDESYIIEGFADRKRELVLYSELREKTWRSSRKGGPCFKLGDGCNYVVAEWLRGQKHRSREVLRGMRLTPGLIQVG